MAPPWLLSALSLLLFTCLVTALENDFSFYPTGAQPCLYKAANATSCSGSSAKMNTCLCGNNSDFITNSARCIGDESPDDVDSTYDTMAEACDYSNTPISVEKKDWQAAAAEGESVTTTAEDTATTATASSTDQETAAFTTTTSGGVTITVVPTNSNDDDVQDEGELSTAATVGIAVGAGAAGAAVIGALIFFFLRRRRRRAEEESHPMLPHWQASDNNNVNNTANNSINSPYPHSAATYSSPAFPPAEPKPAWAGEGSPNASQNSWDGRNTYVGAYAPPNGGTAVAELPPEQMIYEMDGTGTTAEMPGTMEREDEWRKR